jgi:uncharacterized protein YfdQ (DUF2303 family)
MDENTKGIVGALQFTADQQKRAGVWFKGPNGSQYLAVDADDKLLEIEPIDRVLTRVKQGVVIDDQQSFVEYFNAFKTPHSRIFGTLRQRAIMAVIDYHKASNELATPDYGLHRATLQLQHSEEWKRWAEIDNKPIGQMAFAEFLEENYVDVLEPTSAEIIQIITNLESRKTSSFVSGIKIASGDIQLSFVEESETKGKGSGNITIPNDFELGLPVFLGGTVYRVKALLRYRINEGKLVFIVKLNRRQFIEQVAFDGVLEQLAKDVGVKPIKGALQ